MTVTTPAREYFPGMGTAVADRTVNRKIKNADGTTRVETWEEVAHRVALGNSLLDPRGSDAASILAYRDAEFSKMNHHLRQASLLMSGRHLQHGDATQPTRPMEVFTNCGRYDTEVITLEKGVVQIGDVVGQTLTVRTADGEWRPAKFHQHGKQKLYELTFVGKNGRGKRVVHFTRNHRWLLSDGSVTTDIKIGDTLLPAPVHTIRDPDAVIHGLIFGDGTAHKRRRDSERPGVSQGRTYASLRVCKQDAVRDEIHKILDAAGYSFTVPAHANGDRVYYIGKFEHSKELPFTRDPDYIAGFIYGWWLADGHKTEANGTWTISTADEIAASWLCENAVIAGLSVVSSIVKARKDGDGSFANGKDLTVIRLREGVEWKLSAIEEGEIENVYCPEEPITSSFVLANGLLTGNCSTSVTTFIMFYLLLNGSGVGRAYDDDLILADFNKMPLVVPVIDGTHPDVLSGEINGFLTLREAMHKYAGKKIRVFKVPDSREGWAKALEVIEVMTYEGRTDEVLLLDFSGVRERNAPIKGMQNRPASGPGPLMNAIVKIAGLKDSDMPPWRAAMFADHYMAECVLVGGARRAARMATKYWKDKTIFEFIALKRGGFLWSSNNSVTIDKEFRDACVKVSKCLGQANYDDADRLCYLVADKVVTETEAHAWRVLMELARAAYFDGTGEPGIINQDKLVANDEGVEKYLDGLFADGSRLQVDAETVPMMRELASSVCDKTYTMITNPCGEIALLMLGAYCVIADVVPFHASNDADAEDAFRTAVRALIRTNLMDSIYHKEVKRTNRIGVGITGLHEWIYNRFGYTWHDIIDETKSKDMWMLLSKFKRAVVDEAATYSKELGVVVPHTNTTFKPAGCASLDTAIKTTEGVLTMRELFDKHGVTESDLRKMEDGTWIEPKSKTMVLDEGNIEREVTKLYLNGIKPVYEIEFEDGVVVKLTGNHKLKLLSGEWKRVDELTELDEILGY